MTAFDFSFVKNTSFAFDATADSLNMGAIDASSVTITTSGSDLVFTVGSDAVTLQGASIAQLTTTNVTFGTGTAPAQLVVGDNNVLTTVDSIANDIDPVAASQDANNQLIGLDGADSLGAAGDDGNNLIIGGNGADVIITGTGMNTIFGGEGIVDADDGNDTFTIATVGTNTIYGNSGNDTFTLAGTAGSAAGTTQNLFLGTGNDSVTANANASAGDYNIVGGGGANTINIATTGASTISGGVGIVDANDGNDTITVTTGSTTIYGNSGNDNITVGATIANATANVFAGVGDDTINAGGAANSTSVLYGNTGADQVTSTSAGTVSIFGGNGIVDTTDGNDTLTAGTGTNTVYGNAGNDVIVVAGAGAATTSTVFVGAGNDTLNVGVNADGTTANGNNTGTTTTATLSDGGNDRVNFDAVAGELLTVNSFDAANDVFALDISAGVASDLILAGGFIFNDVNNDGVYASATEESVNFASFTGDFTATNMLVTTGGIGGASVGSVITNVNGAAATTLTGGTTADLLVSGSLADTLVGGGGVDQLVGNSGDDVFQLTNTLAEALSGTASTLSGGDGTDVLEITGAAATGLVDADFSATVTSVETLKLGNFTGNSVTLGTNALATGITTVDASAVTSGSTTLIATALEGNLTYLGGAANDLITRSTGTGSDNFDLAGGDDTFTIALGDLSTADTIAGGTGTNVFTMGSAGNITDAQFTNVTGFQTLNLANGANTLTGGSEFTEAGFTSVSGNANTDVINMSARTTAVTIDGNAQDDTITGSSAADNITGGAGSDSITGAGGADTIVLGTDTTADTLNYTAASEFGDTLTGFDSGTDVFTFANSFGDAGLAGAVTWAADAANLGALTTAANADAEGYVVEDVALTSAGIGLIDTAIADGSSATGAGFVLADDGASSVLLYDTDFSTTGNLVLVAQITGLADASSGEGVTVA